MNQKREYKTYTKAFKEEAVALVIDQGFTVPEAAQSLEIRANLLYGWKQQFEDKQSGAVLAGDERSELMKLRKENKQLRMEKEILKKGQCLLSKRNEVKFNFIKQNEGILL